jgi:hypothetical protein
MASIEYNGRAFTRLCAAYSVAKTDINLSFALKFLTSASAAIGESLLVIPVVTYTISFIFISTMSDDENAPKQAKADASPNVEPGHVEGVPNANNPPLTASPNKHLLSSNRFDNPSDPCTTSCPLNDRRADVKGFGLPTIASIVAVIIFLIRKEIDPRAAVAIIIESVTIQLFDLVIAFIGAFMRAFSIMIR